MNDIQATVEAEQADLITDEALEQMASMRAQAGAGGANCLPTMTNCPHYSC
jgi:hypothetical protein